MRRLNVVRRYSCNRDRRLVGKSYGVRARGIMRMPRLYALGSGAGHADGVGTEAKMLSAVMTKGTGERSAAAEGRGRAADHRIVAHAGMREPATRSSNESVVALPLHHLCRAQPGALDKGPTVHSRASGSGIQVRSEPCPGIEFRQRVVRGLALFVTQSCQPVFCTTIHRSHPHHKNLLYAIKRVLERI